MQLSTTTITIFDFPSESARPRAFNGVFTFSTVRLVMPPFTITGNLTGVTSITTAPAWKYPVAPTLTASCGLVGTAKKDGGTEDGGADEKRGVLVGFHRFMNGFVP